ncbi:MAG TPA: hypothetical protein VK661_09965 [Planctomycetota bacterium]|jgi:hypothetical protein|nr:hypothetical protein [Planctomycetota bacterium]
MKTQVSMMATACILMLGACAARTPAPGRYRFAAGESLAYEVKSHLEVSLKGSDADFLPGGDDVPLTWDVEGIFENLVTDVGADGTDKEEQVLRD